jgi:hypothetical protein
MAIPIQPEPGVMPPYELKPQKPATFSDAVHVAASTIDMLDALSDGKILPPEVDAPGAIEAFKTAMQAQDPEQLKTPAVAFAAREFIRAYSAKLAVDAAEVRAALTNKLLEIANCGDIKHELKAIELLGKHSDIALFTERSSVTVNYKSSTELEDAIKTKIQRLIAAKPRAVPTKLDDLDEELGVIIDQEP